MSTGSLTLAALLLVVGSGCYAQDPMTSIANSHVEGNAPKGELFDKYLKRDLTSYFCKNEKDCRIEYDYLRQGATQSGVSYPKYYLWTRCFTKEQLKSKGAVRVAAVNQERFDVTDFLPANDILASPDKVGNIFPASLVDKIVQKAKH